MRVLNDVYDLEEIELVQIEAIEQSEDDKLLLSDEYDYDSEVGYDHLDRFADRQFKVY